MKKLIAGVAVGVVASLGVAGLAVSGASAGPSSAKADTATTTTLASPLQGKSPAKLSYFVDTVQGFQSAVKLPADAACSITNLFQRQEVVVFRLYGVHVTTGGNNLTSVSVKSAYVKVPGLAPIPFVYGNHPTKPVTAYWTAAWTVAKNYPLGVVNWRVTVVTNPVPTGLTAGVPSQTASMQTNNSLYAASPLTIEPSS